MTNFMEKKIFNLKELNIIIKKKKKRKKKNCIVPWGI